MTASGLGLLVLGGQGVVFDAALDRFLALFALTHRLDFADVFSRWDESVRERAWQGGLDETSVFEELAQRSVDVRTARAQLRTFYAPGPAVERVKQWSESLPVWLLTNHRSEWLLPMLDEFGVSRCFERILISDRIGRVKPDPEAFGQVLSYRFAGAQTLVVDDQLHNLCSAAALGFRTLQARPKNRWVEQIDEAVLAASETGERLSASGRLEEVGRPGQVRGSA